MELKNKKIHFLGDSITGGYGLADRENERFEGLIKKRTGAITQNYGVSCSCISLDKNRPFDDCFVTRQKDMEGDADIVVIFGGTNDHGRGTSPLGNKKDRDYTTFYGALHTLYSAVIKDNPRATVVVITPLHRGGEKSNTRGESLKQYVEVIREVAALYSFPVLNLYDEYGIDVTTNRDDIEKYMPDEIHPNALGHTILADKITAFLENL